MKTEVPKYKTRKALKEEVRQLHIKLHYAELDLLASKRTADRAVRILWGLPPD